MVQIELFTAGALIKYGDDLQLKLRSIGTIVQGQMKQKYKRRVD
jgi:hypothetical protein